MSTVALAKINFTEDTKKVVASETQFTDIERGYNIGRLKDVLTAAKATGETITIVKVPVSLLAVDDRIQTPERTERSLSYLINHWDEGKLLPVTGVPHKEEGLIYLCDGWARACASQIVKTETPDKYEYLNCMLILKNFDSIEERTKYEAEYYAYQNRDVKALTPLQKHGAMEILGDPTTLLLDEMKEKYGFEFSERKGWSCAGIIGSYTDLYRTAKAGGREYLDFFFTTCHISGFDKKANGYSTGMIRAIYELWKSYPKHLNNISNVLGMYLRKYEPSKFKAEAITKYPMLTIRMAMIMYVEDIVVDILKLDKKHEVIGDKLKLYKQKTA